MALNLIMTKELCSRLKPGSRIASMGYPDLTASPEALESILQGRAVEYRADSDDICKRHGIRPFRPVMDAESFFKAVGAQLDVFDIVAERGCEIICDLNNPFPEDLAEQYDFVLDVGTMEHCFNVAQAAMNMASLLKQGGVIFHENPFIMGNHGFYSFNPTWYTDFYEQNGFNVLGCALFNGNIRSTTIEVIQPPATQRFFMPHSKDATTIFAMAERVEIQAFKFPVQTKYKTLVAADKPGVGVN